MRAFHQRNKFSVFIPLSSILFDIFIGATQLESRELFMDNFRDMPISSLFIHALLLFNL